MEKKKIAMMMMAVLMGATACGQAKRSEKAGTEAQADSVVVIEGVETRQVDQLRVTWLQDVASKQKAEIFDADPKLIDSLGLQDGVPSTISTFLVETEGKKILFDTGIGGKGGRLLSLLDSIGVKPADIDYLYLTHFHGDHIGGMLSDGEVVFPRAQVYAAQQERDGWLAQSNRQTQQIQQMLDAYADRMHFFAFGDTLPCGVVTIDAVGHTPGHTAYRAGRLLVVGDILHGAALQLTDLNICPVYDMNKPQAIASRKRILQYAKENGLLMAGMHLPAPAFMEANDLP